jgi:hypothetical protein
MNESRRYAALALVLMESQVPRNSDECEITYAIHRPGDTKYASFAAILGKANDEYFVSMTLTVGCVSDTFVLSNHSYARFASVYYTVLDWAFNCYKKQYKIYHSTEISFFSF